MVTKVEIKEVYKLVVTALEVEKGQMIVVGLGETKN